MQEWVAFSCFWRAGCAAGLSRLALWLVPRHRSSNNRSIPHADGTYFIRIGITHLQLSPRSFVATLQHGEDIQIALDYLSEENLHRVMQQLQEVKNRYGI